MSAFGFPKICSGFLQVARYLTLAPVCGPSRTGEDRTIYEIRPHGRRGHMVCIMPGGSSCFRNTLHAGLPKCNSVPTAWSARRVMQCHGAMQRHLTVHGLISSDAHARDQ